MLSLRCLADVRRIAPTDSPEDPCFFMTNIDQFESVFKAADKAQFALTTVEVRKVLVVTDLAQSEAHACRESVRAFLAVLGQSAVAWECLFGEATASVAQLLREVEARGPDLICTYRDLHASAGEYPYSLGPHLDVITQATPLPVLVMPRPSDAAATAVRSTRSVMAITDHLTGDHRLVSYAAKFTHSGGTLWLTHVEDQVTFDRYMDTISRIPSIDTDSARSAIHDQLLKEPRDYIHSCQEVLRASELPLEVKTLVTLGHHLADYRRLISEHEVDLLVLNTKDEDQLAMHGLAYPLTVELRHLPMLLL